MNGIDYSKLRSLTARKLISALRKDGFNFDRQSGSHRQYIHPDGRRARKLIKEKYRILQKILDNIQ